MLQTSSTVGIWVYGFIPIVAALVGFLTNWLAVKMIFHPIQFIGIPPFLGWQGVVPRKAPKMAYLTVGKTVEHAGSVGDLVDEYGLDNITDHWVNTLDEHIEPMFNQVMESEFPKQWAKVPVPARSLAITQLQQHAPVLIEHAVFDVVELLDERFALSDFVTRVLVEKPTILNDLFYKSGRPELKFIIWSGLFFGFLFGFLQTILWFFSPSLLWMPIFGCVVGFVTNWLAITIIFKPLRPVKVGLWSIQGLFVRRQQEVAENYCRLIVNQVINVNTFQQAMNKQDLNAVFEPVLRTQIESYVDSMGFERATIDALLGRDGYTRLCNALSTHLMQLAQQPLQDQSFKESVVQFLHQRLKSEINGLSPEEFRDVLKPVFKEEEWALIFMGAGLGLLMGLIQCWFVL